MLGGGEEVEVPNGLRRQALCKQGWSESAFRYEARSLPNSSPAGTAAPRATAPPALRIPLRETRRPGPAAGTLSRSMVWATARHLLYSWFETYLHDTSSILRTLGSGCPGTSAAGQVRRDHPVNRGAATRMKAPAASLVAWPLLAVKVPVRFARSRLRSCHVRAPDVGGHEPGFPPGR